MPRKLNLDTVNFEDLAGLVGKEEAVSDWVQITQERVNQFADATDDHQWIHVDVERATREIGGPIAHGFLVLSLIPMLAANLLSIKGASRSINYGSDKVRFISMVHVGAFVRLRRRVTGVEPKAGGMLVRNEMTIEIRGETKPACVAETLGIVYRS
jgi:acyl dehydratase